MPDTTLNQTIAPRRRNVLLMVLGLVLAGCGGDEAPPASPSGSLLVEQGPLAGPPALVSISLDGAAPTAVVPEWAGAAAGRWSPDGSRLAWTGTAAEGETSIVIGDLEGGGSIVLAAADLGATATWSSDCRQIAFSA